MNGIVLQSFIKRNRLNSIRFNKINLYYILLVHNNDENMVNWVDKPLYNFYQNN